MQPYGVCSGCGRSLGSRDEGELVAKLVWRVKLVTELQAGETTEVEVARLERDEASLANKSSASDTVLAAVRIRV
jgi:hypothetical protein